LPARIETLEKEQAALIEKLADVGIYRREPDVATAAKSASTLSSTNTRPPLPVGELEAVKNTSLYHFALMRQSRSWVGRVIPNPPVEAKSEAAV